MSPAVQQIDINRLNMMERVELLGRVWDSLLDSDAPPIPDWHREEIARRIARADAEPGTSIPLEELRRELKGTRP